MGVEGRIQHVRIRGDDDADVQRLMQRVEFARRNGNTKQQKIISRRVEREDLDKVCRARYDYDLTTFCQKAMEVYDRKGGLFTPKASPTAIRTPRPIETKNAAEFVTLYLEQCFGFKQPASRVQEHLVELGLLDAQDSVHAWDKGLDYENAAREWLWEQGVRMIPERNLLFRCNVSDRLLLKIVDGLELMESCAVIYEMKSGSCRDAHENCNDYYRPLVEMLYGLPTHVCIVAPDHEPKECESCPSICECEEIDLDERLVVRYGVLRFNLCAD